jgi:hypothetical protein
VASAVSVEIAVADAVLKELQTTTRTLNPVYSRTYNTNRELKDAGILHLDVVNAGHKLNAIARDTAARDPVVQVVIRKRLSNPTRDEDRDDLDRLALLTEEIEQFFFQRWLDEYPAAWQSTETVGPVDEDYAQWRQFTVVVSMTFRVSEDD